MPIQLVYPCYFLLNCMQQVREVRGRVFVFGGFNSASRCEFSIGFRNCSKRVVFFLILFLN